jgi:hypothetical protein
LKIHTTNVLTTVRLALWKFGIGPIEAKIESQMFRIAWEPKEEEERQDISGPVRHSWYVIHFTGPCCNIRKDTI